MDIIIKKLFMNLWLWCASLLEGVFDVFKTMAGIKPVGSGNATLLDIFMESNIVLQGFWVLLIISIVVCAVSMIVAIIKSMAHQGESRKSMQKITGQGISTIAVSVIMAFIMICGIWGANQILRITNDALLGGEDASMAGIIFEMSVENNGEWIEVEYIDPDTNLPVQLIDEFTLEPMRDENGKIMYRTEYVWVQGNSGWANDKSIDDFSVDMTANNIYGQSDKNLIGMETGKHQNNNLIKYDSFNFVIGFLAVIILLIALIMTTVGLVKRLYDIVFLFITLPLMVATIPLDDGARFKSWRETVVSKVVLAFGAVICVNVFLIMMPVVMGLPLNSIARLFLLIGGGLSISGGQLLFARLFGTSAEEGRDLAHSAKTLIAGTASAGGMAAFAGASASRLALGARGQDGTRTGGLIRSSLGLAKGTVNTVGSVLGGDAYRGFMHNTGAKFDQLGAALKGRTVSAFDSFMDKGGAIGSMFADKEVVGRLPGWRKIAGAPPIIPDEKKK